ncbi:zinc fingers and homeoboxes protein 3 [Perognathus longimembris pacificus]|uniref:zinc fingers and homeoboxes protein 3 n=1 Tax=Perognathus longimembris pacificus TaxID=214514 RepID=UPI00201957BA|nr:zinc fingers and homeoboxes protein 3 [Perognathus longimembris pacificus]XP_048205286.1 zinc fingers and homeoboxes protein 3 [Perognathus longimembris pacificus]XP_048205287.1 zinc fingers and homeoboxes protein 3 [Perognathus longimembris pacificus]XP_048205288.1 zinc fingers and homeoboxes protein 3 [Perognathus longimembris pacificus]XP_048205289.1 zinc fingers and homeoboxes protein 3 [Perognathus longimembris pacificus]XP_048205290.1 zinc fingers and homeoboxes protein 3 [Perognathus
MASKRKSTTPCMIPVKTAVLPGASVEAQPAEALPAGPQDPPPEAPASSSEAAQNPSSTEGLALANGHRSTLDGYLYSCKDCEFKSQDITQFVGHMNSEHTDFNKDPNFICMGCSFLAKTPEGLSLHNAKCHSGEASFVWKVAKLDNHVVVEQSVPGSASTPDLAGEPRPEGTDGQAEIIITKTPIMKIMKSKVEAKKIHMLKENVPSQPGSEALPKPAVAAAAAGETEVKEGNHAFLNGAAPASQAPTSSTKPPQAANGPLIGTVPVLPAGIAQFLSLQQQQPPIHAQHHAHQSLPTSKALPKVMIPLSSIPTYNAAMDSNSFLKNSFHKFPYPTKAELCYLTVVTKYPEEQLKIWFTAQRLKQGISWSPEEIEDARKKMFNTVIQSVPQPTITVLNTPLVASAGNVQHLIQAALPGHVVGQPEGTAGGLLVTQPLTANGLQAPSSSLPLTATSVPKPNATPINTVCSNTTSAVKVVNAAQSLLTACPSITSQAFLDASIYKNKKSHEQLSALKGSFCRNQFPGQSEVEHLTKVTGLSTREVRKWFSDRRYHCRNLKGSRVMMPGEHGSLLIDSVPELPFSLPSKAPDATCLPTAASLASHPAAKRQSWHQTPDFTPTKYKERAPEQLRALESSFAQNPLPLDEELDRLRSETKMTRREIDSWFSERRKKVHPEEHRKDDEERAPRDEEAAAEDEGGDGGESASELRVPGENGSPEALLIQSSAERKVSPIKINLKNLRVTEASGKSELPGLSTCEPEEDVLNKLAQLPPGKASYKKTAQQRHVLRQLFVQTQWPSNQDYDSIMAQTGLPRPEVVRWFGDSRYALKNGQLKWYEDYKRGNFPPGLLVIAPGNRELLQDYYVTHKMLYEEDLQNLCDKTHMSAQQVKQWFAEKMGEETRAVTDTGSENQGPSPGEPAAVHKRLEVPENTESSAPEASSEPPSSPQPGLPLETD